MRDDADNTPPPQPPFRFELLNGPAFAAKKYSLDYIIDGVLVADQPMIVAGGQKTLKTSFLADLALSVATGEPFLGRFEVKRQTNVLCFSGESGGATLQETAMRIMHAKGGELEHAERAYFCDKVPYFGTSEHIEALKFALDQHCSASVVILDPAYRIIPTDGRESSLFAMGKALADIAEICSGRTVILAHHTKRGLNHDRHEPPELEDMSFAGFQEFARQWILLSRRETYVPGTGSHRMWMNFGGSVGHSSLWGVDVEEGVPPRRRWDVSMETASSIRASDRDKREGARERKAHETAKSNAAKLLNSARRHPDGETLNIIGTEAGLSGQARSKALETLLSANQLESCEVIKNGRSHPGYRPVPLSESDDSDN